MTVSGRLSLEKVIDDIGNLSGLQFEGNDGLIHLLTTTAGLIAIAHIELQSIVQHSKVRILSLARNNDVDSCSRSQSTNVVRHFDMITSRSQKRHL